MAMKAHDIQAMVQSALPDAAIELKDLAGDGDHFSITVVSSLFQGKSRVQQHKMVFDALGGGMGTQLHALQVTTKVKEL